MFDFFAPLVDYMLFLFSILREGILILGEQLRRGGYTQHGVAAPGSAWSIH